MTLVETISLYAAISAYILAAGFGLLSVMVKSKIIDKLGMAVILGGLAAQTLSIGLRWVDVGHPPVFGTFENALAGSWFVIVFGVSAQLRWGRLFPGFYPLAGPAAVAVIWFGLSFDRAKYPLTISEQSLWLDLHATIAWLAYASLTFAFIIALSLIFGRGRFQSALSNAPVRLPAGEAGSDLMAKYVNYVFVMQAAMIASGSYYEFRVFGRWWRWDAVESLSLGSWLVLALFIHLKRSFGWKGSSLAWLVIISFILAVVAYWLLAYFPPGSTFHVFDIIGREHVL